MSGWKCSCQGFLCARVCVSVFWRLTVALLQGSDSEYEMDQSRQKTHSFVNHYISDPTYYNSWRRQQKGVSRPPAYGYSQPEPLVEQESRPHPPPVPPLPPLLPQSAPSPQPQCQGPGQGNLFRPKGSRTPTPSLLSSDPPSQHSTLYRPPSSLGCAAQAPTAGFSSFVWHTTLLLATTLRTSFWFSLLVYLYFAFFFFIFVYFVLSEWQSFLLNIKHCRHFK